MKKLLIPLLMLSMNVGATTLFSDDFESGLGQWTAGSGQIVSDPLQADNALNFRALGSGGDIFTSSTISNTLAGKDYILEFDYLGICSDSDCGGFIGYSTGFPASHIWLGGTGQGYPDLLPDTGVWEHVTINFTSYYSNFHLMVEDFVGSGAPAGDAYFDNIVLTAVPEPATMLLFAMGLTGFGLMRKNRK